jgi:hypothetical protein
LIGLKPEIIDLRKGIEILTFLHRFFGMATKDLAWIVAVCVTVNERKSPIKGPDETIIVPFVVSAFAPVHVILPQNWFTSC